MYEIYHIKERGKMTIAVQRQKNSICALKENERLWSFTSDNGAFQIVGGLTCIYQYKFL